eukprot:15447811-Alexandrium_andersonii.AAC.1
MHYTALGSVTCARTLRHATLGHPTQRIKVHCNTASYNTIRCAALHCSTWRYVPVHGKARHHVAVQTHDFIHQ